MWMIMRWPSLIKLDLMPGRSASRLFTFLATYWMPNLLADVLHLLQIRITRQRRKKCIRTERSRSRQVNMVFMIVNPYKSPYVQTSPHQV